MIQNECKSTSHLCLILALPLRSSCFPQSFKENGVRISYDTAMSVSFHIRTNSPCIPITLSVEATQLFSSYNVVKQLTDK
jgi:hypothetical protein